MLFFIDFVMKFGVPVGQFVNEFSDIELEYEWFNNADDARAHALTVDMFWTDDDPINQIITMGS